MQGPAARPSPEPRRRPTPTRPSLRLRRLMPWNSTCPPRTPPRRAGLAGSTRNRTRAAAARARPATQTPPASAGGLRQPSAA
eukprot:scaffold188_cov107-Isochrysis_galbana.AAC.18